MTVTRESATRPASRDKYAVGYKRPPEHSRFKPGQSGNPSGRRKGSQNLKTIFEKILKEEVSLREGNEVRKVTKAEALMRGLVVGALKGDQRNVGTLLRIAEQAGHFTEPGQEIGRIERVIVSWKGPEYDGDPRALPAISQISRDDEDDGEA
ncbi:DUF5681 domain-containing protein [Pseudorhodoplanes sp.]|uniref:DUF5681 domain-containing protein n=1 Tax=Pseudorhodoplanes sp. TaxID=1934341 RepID=UPI003D11B29E